MEIQELKDKANQGITEINAKLQDLESKMENVTGDLKVKYADQIEELKQKKDELSTKLEEWENVAEEKWDDLKENAENALGKVSGNLKESFSKLTSFFKSEEDEKKA